jgi:hypothetical protein
VFVSSFSSCFLSSHLSLLGFDGVFLPFFFSALKAEEVNQVKSLLVCLIEE